MAARKHMFLSQNSNVTKIWGGNAFPKEFFNEIGLKIREHKCIYIFEIRFGKKNILLKNGGQNKFCDIVQ